MSTLIPAAMVAVAGYLLAIPLATMVVVAAALFIVAVLAIVVREVASRGIDDRREVVLRAQLADDLERERAEFEERVGASGEPLALPAASLQLEQAPPVVRVESVVDRETAAVRR